MSEILFRGKRIDNNEWIEGNLALPNYELPNNAGLFWKVQHLYVFHFIAFVLMTMIGKHLSLVDLCKCHHLPLDSTQG